MAPRTAQRRGRKTRRVEPGAGSLRGQRAAAAAEGQSARLAPCRPPPRAARPEGHGRLTAGWQVAPGRAGLQSRAQEVSWSLRQLSPACCGRRLPRRRRQSPVRSRHAVGCMSSSRLYSPPPPPPAPRPRRPPRPQLSRSRHANFWLGTKGSARAGRGRARLPRAARPARPPLAGSARLAGGSPPPSPRCRAAPPRPGSPPGSPGTRRGEPGEEGGAEPGRGAAEPEGGGDRGDWRPRHRGRGFCATRGEGARRPPLGWRAHAHRAPGAGGRAPPPERARGGERHQRQSQPRSANPLTKESPALPPLARPLSPPPRPSPPGS